MTATEPMVGFGFKQAWLAVRDVPAGRVIDALGLRDLGPLGWRPGIDLSYFTDDRVVLTPPLPGRAGPWTLVVGRWLFPERSDVDIAHLSGRLVTEVQHFATYRVGDLHRWQRAEHGELVRSFRYTADLGVTDWRGDPDDAERAAHLPATFDPDESTVLVDESDVMSVAAAWSLDPTTLDGHPSPGPLTAAASP